jgi:ABC-2 type transport system ATP-binding protein
MSEPNDDLKTAIHLAGVSKRYTRRGDALQQLSISVSPGECLGIIGLNGAGKSTLLKCILDLVKPDDGEITLFDVSSHSYQSRAPVAYLPEQMQPPHYMTGRQFLDFARRLHKIDPKETNTDLMNVFDFDPSALDKPVRKLSKGMAQKLSLMAVLGSGKRLFILDEPAGGLDPLARYRLQSRLMAMKRQGATLLVTSHLLQDLAELCDRLGVIHEGKLRFIGMIGELTTRYGENLNEAFLKCINADTGAVVVAQ